MNLFIEMITIIAEVALFWFFFSKHIYTNSIPKIKYILFVISYSLILTFSTFFLSVVFRLLLYYATRRILITQILNHFALS